MAISQLILLMINKMLLSIRFKYMHRCSVCLIRLNGVRPKDSRT